MKKIYTLITALFLTIISFGQTWEEIEVPDNIIIKDVYINKNNILISTSDYNTYINTRNNKWEKKLQTGFFKSGNNLYSWSDSILLSINTDNLQIDTLASLSWSSFHTFNIIGGKTIIASAQSIQDTNVILQIYTSNDLGKSWDTLIVKERNPSCPYQYLNPNCITESKNGTISIGVINIGFGSWIYQSEDYGKTWVLDSSDYYIDAMYYDNNNNFYYAIGGDGMGLYKNHEHLTNFRLNNIECGNSISQILVDTNEIIYVVNGGRVYSSKNNGLTWKDIFDNNLKGFVLEIMIGDDGYMYALTKQYDESGCEKQTKTLYRLSEPIYKSPNITAINNNIHTDNILNGTFRIYSAMGTYCGTIEIQNNDLSYLKKKIKKGVYILQNIDNNQTVKIIM